ncbi:hypothetical protein KY084_01545 [Stakelama sp. CBK3Z-3]|uniref:Lipoprotein n=1 Tax=Stakelama flava TaxID=2860338 RepID=A0ABS6XH74_9SPHN|nr:hypothetical protein [Stakelama flava]MBW4329560.1 hypothetical protein [Stakelama flava]
MARIHRIGLMLLAGCSAAALSGCDGADSVASPGAGTVVVNPTPAPAPTPTPTPGASFTAEDFASNDGEGDSGITITPEEQLQIAESGDNVVADGTSPLSGLLAANAAATLTATDMSGVDAFFDRAQYIGALNGQGDTSFSGWTCNSSAANFGSDRACTDLPMEKPATTPAASACASGTTDAGVINDFRICTLPSQINGTYTLPYVAGVIYRLSGLVQVGTDMGTTGNGGGTVGNLTIQPGVVIASDSDNANNDALLVNRGSQIHAVGTADNPIIFTSGQSITTGGVSEGSQGQWGGVILLGQAPTAVCASGTGPNNAAGSSTTCENAIEGFASPHNYGGPDAADSSGEIEYVQINYSGIAIAPGNELQSLTLGGVGSGTTIDHLQTFNSSDDGIEFFGGTVNLKHLALIGADDDSLDTDNGWRGMIQYVVIAQKVGGSTDDSFAFEIDSNGNEDLLPRQYGQVANVTVIHTSPSPAALRIRGGADYHFYNMVVDTDVPCLNMIAREKSQSDRSTVRPADSALQDLGPPMFTSVYFACSGR